MGRYEFSIDIAAPVEQVFDLWTNLDRAQEWIGGLTKVTDVTGPTDQAGTRYTSWFGRMSSPTEVLEAERPRMIRTRFGSWLLRGEMGATFEEAGGGTHLTQSVRTKDYPAVSAWTFAHGSYSGSFKGELKAFAALAERDARKRAC